MLMNVYWRQSKHKELVTTLLYKEDTMDFKEIKLKAEGYKKDMSRFLRDLIAIPGESCG